MSTYHCGIHAKPVTQNCCVNRSEIVLHGENRILNPETEGDRGDFREHLVSLLHQIRTLVGLRHGLFRRCHWILSFFQIQKKSYPAPVCQYQDDCHISLECRDSIAIPVFNKLRVISGDRYFRPAPGLHGYQNRPCSPYRPSFSIRRKPSLATVFSWAARSLSCRVCQIVRLALEAALSIRSAYLFVCLATVRRYVSSVPIGEFGTVSVVVLIRLTRKNRYVLPELP